jgi:hypothetical protein
MGSQEATPPFALMTAFGSSAQIALWQAGNHWDSLVIQAMLQKPSQCTDLVDSQSPNSVDCVKPAT